MPPLREAVIASCDFQSAGAFWIAAAAPELFAGVDSLFCHALDHGLATTGTGGGVVLEVLLRAVCQTVGCESLCEATFLSEGVQLAFYLSSEHESETIAKHEQAVGCQKRVTAVQPEVKLMFLCENVNAAQVQHIVLVVRPVQSDVVYCHILWRIDRPGDALMPQKPV